MQILNCPIAKAGSTSLKETIVVLQNKFGDKKILPSKKYHFNQSFDKHHVIKNPNVNQVTIHYKKFIIVREPMERLVSAFNDLFIVSDRKGLQREVLKNTGGKKVTFKDFIHVVVLPQKTVGKCLLNKFYFINKVSGSDYYFFALFL